MRIYGYELTWPGFADQAITALKKAGCSRAGKYYQRFVGEYEREHDKEMQQAAEWYRKQTERKESGRDWKRQQEAELLTRKSQLLKKKLRLLKQKKAEQNQHVTMVVQDR